METLGQMWRNPGPLGGGPGFSLIRRDHLAAGVSGDRDDRKRYLTACLCRGTGADGWPNDDSLKDSAVTLYCTLVYSVARTKLSNNQAGCSAFLIMTENKQP